MKNLIRGERSGKNNLPAELEEIIYKLKSKNHERLIVITF